MEEIEATQDMLFFGDDLNCCSILTNSHGALKPKNDFDTGLGLSWRTNYEVLTDRHTLALYWVSEH